MKGWEVGVALFLCTFAFLQQQTSADFDPSRVHFVDKSNYTTGQSNNFLFRGNEPVYGNSTFAWDDVVATVRKVAQTEANVTLPSDFYLIDISFLNIFEYYDEEIEISFFQTNPHLGSYVNWPITGDLVDPNDLYVDVLKPLAETLNDWQLPDQVPTKMEKLRSMLLGTGPNGRSLVIYMHCQAGEDRTGEISGSYYVKWLHWGFRQALDYDNHVEHRHIAWLSKNGFQWYCYYLVYVENRVLECSYEGTSKKAIATVKV